MHGCEFVFAEVEQAGVAACLEEHQRAQPFDEIAGELAQIGTLISDGGHHAQGAGEVVLLQGRDEFRNFLRFGGAEQATHLFERDGVATVGHELIEDAERIAHTAGGRAGDRFGHARLKREVLGLGDVAQVPRCG